MAQPALLEQLVAEPRRHRRLERLEAARHEGEIGLDQPVELAQRLVVEHDVVELAQPDAGLLQAIRDRVGRERGVVLLPREALLLRRRDHAPVDDQRRRAVVIEGRNSEYPHWPRRLSTAGSSTWDRG